ncbi:3-isopropylmalate dehydratase large subunit [Leptospira ognonensis]|uniref:3-isopropylmalate dehydratase large subunit n=1 Tax=Leptospira ognonensis TaxID=2484945 RepID=A0A4R9JVH5_9LEPT|nr:3-isopropylmalate dehydratase large subunit [Leptospira ognonensis]TGL56984.1 3-isopropylmalate dehydratase large subunit [Leptospira ognonensis]
MEPKTLYDKIWEKHEIAKDDEESILYVDQHLLHEVTSPQPFQGLREKNRKVHRLDKTFAVVDHNISTRNRSIESAEPISKRQMELMVANTKEFGVTLLNVDHPDQGIVHVVGPELGLTLPGSIIACGDSHTSTHGAFGALAFGVGSSDVEHILATQTVRMKKSKSMLVQLHGKVEESISAKDIALFIISQIGTEGGQGYVIEFQGDVIRAMSMEERMTLCNLSVEAGARSGMIASDEITFEYLLGRDFAPNSEQWQSSISQWRDHKTDENALFDKVVHIDLSRCANMVSWGTNPSQVIPIEGEIPDPDRMADDKLSSAARSALAYMDLKPGTKMREIHVDKVFVGSCTNGRLEDIRKVAKVVEGKKVHSSVQAIVVPGSGRVKHQAEAEGLDKVLLDAGFEWRHPGCSMCLGMNDDQLQSGERAASTSNRNFENRQGRGGRTHLVSPEVAAATAILGRLGTKFELEKGVTK